MKNNLFLLVLFLGLLIVSTQCKTKTEVVEYETIIFNDAKIYIRTRCWGIAGNHDEIILSINSLDEKSKYNEDTDYIFYSPVLYYKLKSPDSLLIYLPQWNQQQHPREFEKVIKVGFIGPINIKEEEYAEKGIHIIRTTKN